ncbi:MAG: DNA polymerase I, partial [Alphaproteobacteria bacterium]|nr:DNA polymerase I [Alphaproteobacteria bacterium]
REQVIEKFGVPPELVVDAQALIGDTSDNVPGVPGIGPKTAAELLLEFGSLEGVLSRASEIKQQKRRESLIQFAEQARMSRRLVELDCNAPVPHSLDELQMRAPQQEVLVPFLQAQNFKSIISRAADRFKFGAIPAASVAVVAQDSAAAAKGEYTLVSDEAALLHWVAEAEQAGIVAFDTETTGLDAMQAELVGVSLAVIEGKACYIPFGHVTEGVAAEAAKPAVAQVDLFAAPPEPEKISTLRAGQLPLETAIAILKPLLENPAVLKIGQNIKYDMQILARYGVDVQGIEDTMLMSYVLDAGLHGHGMDELAQLFLNHACISYDAVTGTGRARKSFAEVELEPARDYAAEDADVTLRLYNRLKPRVVAEKMLTVYETLERRLVPVLRRMEAEGIKVDVAMLEAMSADFAIRIKGFEEEIYQLAGREFTVGSPKQLGEVLFDELKLDGGKKSAKSGAYATGAEVLEELAESGHDIAAKVLEWRQLSKLKSTYTDALKNQINPKTGRVHTSFSMAVASTGRLSSSDPNLQNIPIRTEEGRKIRNAFVAEKGKKLISADYSQIELRLLAHIADMQELRQAFRDGRDIHAATASQMFGVPLDEVNGDLRRKAKTINFGIIYGISAHGLAQRLGISRQEAAQYIEQYFLQYPGIKAYMTQATEFAHAHGYVQTLYGRKVHLKDINNKNPNLRNFSERAAINAPLQGTAADIIKRAMIALDARLKAELPEAKMLLQVHDELLVEAPEALAERAAAIMKEEMERAADLSIPLTVEVNWGDDWGSIH